MLFRSGARERQGTVTTGFAGAGGKLRGTLAVDYYDRDPLYASQRAFSKAMDHRTRIQGYSPTSGAPVYGTDQRIQWGYPASVQATAATGFASIPGIRVVLAPPGSATTPAVAAFERRTTNDPGQTGTAIVAQGQRITNPAPWTQLVSAAERRGATVHANQAVVDVRPLGAADGSDGYFVTSERPGAWLRKDRRTWHARGVVFAAGALGTNELLATLKHGGALPRLSDRVGALVRTNSESILAVTLPDDSRKPWADVAISASIHVDANTHIELCTFGRHGDAMSFLLAPLTGAGTRLTRPARLVAAALRHPSGSCGRAFRSAGASARSSCW